MNEELKQKYIEYYNLHKSGAMLHEGRALELLDEISTIQDSIYPEHTLQSLLEARGEV